ncbi:MAG: ABC transporter permease [Gemmatimonadales bacterium]|jgi:predicted permease
MDSILQDLRYAVRGLMRSPGFTLAVIATLALGIGANTTMFSVIDTTLLRPPAHVEDPSRVARLYFRINMMGEDRVNPSTAFPALEALGGAHAFSAVAGFTDGQVSAGLGADARPLHVRAVTSSYFPLLGARPALGRFFDSTEDRLGGTPAVVVSHTYWMRQMGGAPDVLHRTLAIGPFVYSVIGVAPDGFTGAELDEPDLWLPIRQAAPVLGSAEALSSWNWIWVQAIARLAPGATREGAAAEAQVVYDRAQAASGGGAFFAGPRPAPGPGGGQGPHQSGPVQRVAPPRPQTVVLLGPIQAARGPEMSSDAKVALWVGLVALAVLLVACANVGNLLLARGLRRRTELAVRAGLGAGRALLVRQLLVESFVLALAGGVAGLLVAVWGGAAVRTYLIPRVAPGASLFDPRVLAFTLVVALVTGMLAGIAPAWQASRTDIAAALRSSGRDLGAARGRLRSVLLAMQVALTLVLLVGAGLFVRSLRHAQTLDYGLDLNHLLLAGVQQRGANVSVSRQSMAPSPEGPVDAQSAQYLRMRERIAANPAVASADAMAGTPYQSAMIISIRVSGRDTLPRIAGGGPFLMVVTPTYFGTVGTGILAGRGFADTDVKGSMPVAVVGQSFARFAWPDRDPIGQCIIMGAGGPSTCIQVVGVASDVRNLSVTRPTTMTWYLAFEQHLVDMPLDGLVIRARGPADKVEGQVQHALQVSESDLPYVRVQTLGERIAPQWRSWRLGATMLSVFGLLALVIASLGLYGVTAYGVTQRTQEIGVRIALGAGRRDVVGLAVAQALRATGIGALVGVLLAFALGRAVSSLLFGIKPADPASVLGAIVVLLAVAALAAYLPARRAAAIDPMEALRYE